MVSPLTFLIGMHLDSHCAVADDLGRCMIVKTDPYNKEQIGKVVQMRANVEGLKLGPGVLESLATEGEKSSLRSVFIFLFLKDELTASIDMHFNF